MFGNGCINTSFSVVPCREVALDCTMCISMAPHCTSIYLFSLSFSLSHTHTHTHSDTSTIDEESDHQLPKEKIILLTSCQPVIDYLNTCDHILYQCIVDFLIPDVLRPIPGTLTQAIRNFAKSLEGWLSGNIHGYSSNLIKAKVSTYVILLKGGVTRDFPPSNLSFPSLDFWNLT